MTGQGETVQLLNHGGAAGFGGLEGWESPPFRSHTSSRPSARRSQLKPWAGREGSNAFGEEPSPFCLLVGRTRGGGLSAGCQCLFCLWAGCFPQNTAKAFSPRTQLFQAFFGLEKGFTSVELQGQSAPSGQSRESSVVPWNLL